MIDHPEFSTGKAKSAELPLFRFGLRQMFGFIAAACVLLTGMVLAGGITALAILVAALVVTLHVLGTTIGTALRARSDRRCPGPFAMHQSGSATDTQHRRPGFLTPDAPQLAKTAPNSPWYTTGSTPLPWRRKLVAGGAAIGAMGGGLFLMFDIGPRENLPGFVIGTLSLAILGGWLVFLGSSFYAILRHGVRDAARRADP